MIFSFQEPFLLLQIQHQLSMNDRFRSNPQMEQINSATNQSKSLYDIYNSYFSEPDLNYQTNPNHHRSQSQPSSSNTNNRRHVPNHTLRAKSRFLFNPDTSIDQD